MDSERQDVLWPPGIGDYVRVRHGGVLGEVIDVAFTQATSRYTVNVFSTTIGEPVALRLDELESVWHEWPSIFVTRSSQQEAPGAPASLVSG